MNETVQKIETDNDSEDQMEWFDSVKPGIDSKKVAIAGVFAALSIAFSFIAEYLPRHPGWGIAYFDPVSIIWIVSFLIGGFWIGSTTAIAGTLGLFIFDPTGIGPVFKFAATYPMILVPYLGLLVIKQADDGSNLSHLGKLSVLMFFGLLLRLAFMIPMNLQIVPLFVPDLTPEYIIITVILLNILQSVWDTIFPYLIVHKTGVFENYRMW
ncbi:MAG: hypothetical protein GF411_11630 [Candidatus Lokiarchaeota archaeon]|nr:hypothetical protein [Candidatus Lokiarchaeota archaeon]